jgi:hypothetical protein
MRVLPHPLSLGLLSLASACLHAAEPTPARPSSSPLDQLLEEQRGWIFEPIAGRTDIFYDLVDVANVQSKIDAAALATDPKSAKNSGQEREKILDWSRRELERVEGFILSKKWEDAMKVCDTSTRTLSRLGDDKDAAQIAERFKRYRVQAEDAKTYEEAQAQFDALAIKVEGILWAPTGSMTIIGGESKPLRLNDRVKDCVIINIDTNRVDFLFHYNHRRFEFQRYVGESLTGDASTTRNPSKK